MLLSLFIINLNISLNFLQGKLDILINYCTRWINKWSQVVTKWAVMKWNDILPYFIFMNVSFESNKPCRAAEDVCTRVNEVIFSPSKPQMSTAAVSLANVFTRPQFYSFFCVNFMFAECCYYILLWLIFPLWAWLSAWSSLGHMPLWLWTTVLSVRGRLFIC